MMKTWQRRVLEEEIELSIKIVRLESFIELNGRDSDLEHQLFIMKDYRAILKKRISQF